jgi:hypothetical protein
MKARIVRLIGLHQRFNGGVRLLALTISLAIAPLGLTGCAEEREDSGAKRV